MATLSTRVVSEFVCSALGCLCAGLVAMPRAAAQEPATYSLRIDAQPLETALQQFARQSGVQVVFFSAITDGLDAPALEGSYTLTAAMDRLLGETGLDTRMLNPQTVEIRRPPGARARASRSAGSSYDAREPKPRSIAVAADRLEEVVVLGSAEQLVATRIATPLLEIPQTVSIIEREQLRQQNSTDLAKALAEAPGITVVRTTSLDQLLYSRGYEIRSFHVDGGAALVPRINTTVLFHTTPDLSEFDDIEVLRGADALFSGNANPGGTVSLVRKRALGNPQLALSVWSGSWSDRRAELDLTGPIAFDGALRGRVDAVYSQQDYFYNSADLRRKKIFAVTEYDFGPQSTLTVGGSYQRDDAVPFAQGLPLYGDGRDPHLPRHLSLTFDWAYQKSDISEAYLQFRQRFSDDWALKVNAASWRTQVEYGFGSFNSIWLIEPATGGLRVPPNASFTSKPNVSRQLTADVTLTGVLNAFGMREEIAFGGDFTRLRTNVDGVDYFEVGEPLGRVAEFDPRAYPDPRTFTTPTLQAHATSTLDQYGAFGAVRVYFDDAWSTVVGARIGSDEATTHATISGSGLTFPLSAQYGSDNVLNPYAGLMYTFARGYSLYASYADIYLTGANLQRIDGGLLGPAHGANMELGLKGEWRDGALNGTMAVYRIAQRNFPITDRSKRPPGLVAVNCCWTGGVTRSKGVDLELSGEVVPGWLIGAGYTYNVNEDTDGAALSFQTPKHLLKLWTSRRLTGVLDNWNVGGSVHAQSKTANGFAQNCDEHFQNCTAVNFVQDGYAILDLRLGYDITPNWRVALNANNVFDTRYYETLGAPSLWVWYGEPRSYMLRIDAEY